jgi:TRAP-type C4-dicarboxylate transport system substrate-binding protein
VGAGFFITQFHPAELPAASLMSEITGLGTDPYATMGALNEAFFVTCQQCRDDMRALGIVPLLMQSATPLTMQCTDEATVLADLEGRRVSTIGQPEMRWAESIGMTPVRTSISDILTSLQLGQSDCTLIGTSWIRSYGLEDTVTSVIEMPQGIIAGAVPMAFNQGIWDSLSEEDRQTMVALMPQMLWDYVADAYVAPDLAVRSDLEERIVFTPGDDAMQSAWVEFQSGEPAALKALAASRGIENSDELIDSIVEVFRVWHEDLLPEFEGDPDAFARIAEERIFSQYDF